MSSTEDGKGDKRIKQAMSQEPKKMTPRLGARAMLVTTCSTTRRILLKILQDMWDLRPEAWRQLYTKNSEWDIPFWGRFTPLTIIMVVQNRPVPFRAWLFCGHAWMWGCVFEHGEGKKGEKGKKKRGRRRCEMGKYNKKLGPPCSCHFFHSLWSQH